MRRSEKCEDCQQEKHKECNSYKLDQMIKNLSPKTIIAFYGK